MTCHESPPSITPPSVTDSLFGPRQSSLGGSLPALGDQPHNGTTTPGETVLDDLRKRHPEWFSTGRPDPRLLGIAHMANLGRISVGQIMAALAHSETAWHPASVRMISVFTRRVYATIRAQGAAQGGAKNKRKRPAKRRGPPARPSRRGKRATGPLIDQGEIHG